MDTINRFYLRKYVHSNILKILPPKNEYFQMKKKKIFFIFIPRRGGSNEYPHHVLSKNKKNNVYPCKPQFYYIKVGFKGVKIISSDFKLFC